MTSTAIYHYVYRITNLVEKKHYYGKRSSKIEPKLDLGVKYFSSSTDKEFKADQKLNPQNYRYKIVQIFPSSDEAFIREIKLHAKFNVKKHPRFYNKANSLSSGFSCDLTGIPRTKETRDKISLGNLGKIRSEDYKRKMSECKIGIKLSEDHKRKIALAGLGRIPTKETREKLSKLNSKENNPNWKIIPSEETIEKLRKAAIAHNNSITPEQAIIISKKISDKKLGIPKSTEMKISSSRHRSNLYFFNSNNGIVGPFSIYELCLRYNLKHTKKLIRNLKEGKFYDGFIIHEIFIGPIQ